MRPSSFVRLATATAIVAAAIVAASSMPVRACEAHRSTTAKRAFAHGHSCPATGRVTISCKGYVIDHVVPLCAGGPDTPANMQWQGVKAAAAKDRREVAYCACLRAKRPSCTLP